MNILEVNNFYKKIQADINEFINYYKELVDLELVIGSSILIYNNKLNKSIEIRLYIDSTYDRLVSSLSILNIIKDIFGCNDVRITTIDSDSNIIKYITLMFDTL